jgi:hypothetical protein
VPSNLAASDCGRVCRFGFRIMRSVTVGSRLGCGTTCFRSVRPLSIDFLRPGRATLGSRGRCGTRPGTLLRSQIPVRTQHWDVSVPGYIEADTVAHCGQSMAGEFCWTVTATDVRTQWTESRAVWNRSQAQVLARIAEIEAALPFPILGFDTDNGGEFINWHLFSYFHKRPRPVHFTRSRAYRKNDNARVEQKNWTHVRQLIGYGRLEGEQVAELLNAFYAREWSLFRNFFCPVMKHLRTEVQGSRKRRIYDQPATPFERLRQSGKADPAQLALKALCSAGPLCVKGHHRSQAPGRAAPSSPAAAHSSGITIHWLLARS